MSIREKRYDTSRYRFKEGDRVRTISEYERKPFSGIVMFFKSGFVYVEKDDGTKGAIHPYWLKKTEEVVP